MEMQTPDDNKTEPIWNEAYHPEEHDLSHEEDSFLSYFQPGPSDRSSQYVPGLGASRYYPALRNLAPVRRKKKNKNNLGVDESGLWSFLTYGWLTKYMNKAYVDGLSVDDIPNPCPQDTCEFNVQRLENLWQDELINKGPQSASLSCVTWRFIKTRVIVSCIFLFVCLIAGFINVAFFMRYLLEYAESNETSYWTGLKWVFCFTFTELIRTTFYAFVWSINYRTAIRLRTAFQGMLYRKILRVHSFGDKSIGEIINLFSNDGQRIFDLVIFGPMVIAGPACLLLGIIYVYWILGPWPILGLCSIFLFYPLQYFLSQYGGFLKRKVYTVSDSRLTLISEILNSMRFIKLYAMAKIFITKINVIRQRELYLLQKVSYCNTFSSSLSSSAPVIAGILTFLIHIMVEKNITASQAFTVMTLYFNLLRKVLQYTREGLRSIIDYKYTLQRFKAFPIISYLFITMRLYITYLQYGITNIVELTIICKRFKSVMLLNESATVLSRPLDKSQAVCIADGCFAHYRNIDQTKKYIMMRKRKSLTLRRNTANAEELEKDLLNNPPLSNYAEILFDINFFAPRGSLIGICGPVGSGKTSLLSGILGHLNMTKGKLCREGNCAYVSQQPWLINATVRENILFGEKFMSRRYYTAVQCCDLGKDIHSLPGGDSTEIGERGVNLSGGQKQRIALARAVYSDRDIYLLDDPLSAVDGEVARHIFEECVLRALYSKTVIFVSHQFQFLNQCNEIVIMKEGRIVERGAPNELLSKDSEYKLMLDSLATKTADQHILKGTNCGNNTINIVENGLSYQTSKKLKRGIDGILIREEKSIHGALKSSTFMSYVRACGGIFFFMILLLITLSNVGASAFSSWWLHLWIKSSSGNNASVIENYGNSSVDFVEPENSTTENYESTPMATSEYPTTEIYNLTIDHVDLSIFQGNIVDNPQYRFYRNIYCFTIAAIFLTSFIKGIFFTKITLKASSFIHQNLIDKLMKTYMTFFETTPIGRLQNLFSRDIDEVETRLPVTLESLIQGLWNVFFSLLFICLAFPLFILPLSAISVFFYFVQKKFSAGLRELKRLDNMTRSPILSNVSTTVHGIDSIHAFGKEKGFILRYNASYDTNTTCSYMCSIANRWLAVRVDAIAVLIILITSLFVIFMHGIIPPSLAGLALAYSTTLCGAFQYLVRLVTDNEVKLVSLERINSYLECMEEEGGHGPKGVPKDTWPELGSIRFKNVELKYRDELEPALKELSFHIRSEEKIGIVGRTGAGKSSIIAALFRLVELSKGSITIDNLDIANIDLMILRSKLSIIPQDPVLFSGTIRSNLDPAEEHSDEVIWSVLEKTSLKSRISMSEDKLNMKVQFNGDNISIGEKKLLCLARALLHKSKILVLDEATSGLDHETENVIKNTLFTEMKFCTVLIIAHRLETILECHRILIMEDGQVVEFDEPKTLLQNPNSRFLKMMNASQPDNPSVSEEL